MKNKIRRKNKQNIPDDISIIWVNVVDRFY